MKKLLYLSLIAFIGSSCSYTVYDMSKGELPIAKKSTYKVEYTSEIPDGTTALISYQDVNNVRHIEEHHKGNFNKAVELPSGQNVKLTVDVKLPKTSPASQLVTTIKVDGEVVDTKTQTGKKVLYRFEFKLP
ncbi:hypothetical protein ACFQZI_04580 [Mucilaginibacter lutimaris]|uniref:Lipoprotein n=1 Tax=Mucilaginibacter lutimaris TaxID=931629 RepID=A0ABW2ZD68_9SPHI